MARKRTNKLGTQLAEDNLGEYSGGINGGIARMRVKCPVEGCNFECNTFHEMNIHMLSAHPERC